MAAVAKSRRRLSISQRWRASWSNFIDPSGDSRNHARIQRRQRSATTHGNSQLLAQALVNLIENAIKYVSPAGASIVSVGPSRTAIVLHVADNGPGIPAADRQRILQPFVRLERDRSRSAAARPEPGRRRDAAASREPSSCSTTTRADRAAAEATWP
jgi:signal transduction histidine kinase